MSDPNNQKTTQYRTAVIKQEAEFSQDKTSTFLFLFFNSLSLKKKKKRKGNFVCKKWLQHVLVDKSPEKKKMKKTRPWRHRSHQFVYSRWSSAVWQPILGCAKRIFTPVVSLIEGCEKVKAMWSIWGMWRTNSLPTLLCPGQSCLLTQCDYHITYFILALTEVQGHEQCGFPYARDSPTFNVPPTVTNRKPHQISDLRCEVEWIQICLKWISSFR